MHTHTSSCLRESDDYTHVHTPLPTLDLYVCANTHAHLVRVIYSPSRSASITHTHSCLLEIWLMMTLTYTLIPMPTLDLLHKHISSRLQERFSRTQLAYLFHQCATSLLSRDGRIADCTVRHPGVERPFSSNFSHCLLPSRVCTNC